MQRIWWLFGHFILNISEHVNECSGFLDAENKEDEDLINAEGNACSYGHDCSSIALPESSKPFKG